MEIKTTSDALKFTSETKRLIVRAAEALEHSAKFGPVGLGEFLEPVQRIHEVLDKDVPELERVIAQRLR